MPGVQTMQGLLAYAAAPAPYPFFEGETQKNSRRAKEDVVRNKGREFSPDLKIDTIDNLTLARFLVSYQKPLEIKEGELVEPIGVRRNKNRTYVECKFISPEPKAEQQMLASMKCPELQKVNAASSTVQDTYQMILHGDWEVFPPLFSLPFFLGPNRTSHYR
jgi:hypothetical protein